MKWKIAVVIHNFSPRIASKWGSGASPWITDVELHTQRWGLYTRRHVHLQCLVHWVLHVKLQRLYALVSRDQCMSVAMGSVYVSLPWRLVGGPQVNLQQARHNAVSQRVHSFLQGIFRVHGGHLLRI